MGEGQGEGFLSWYARTGVIVTPAIKAFVEHLRSERTLGQIVVTRVDSGFEVRHAEDQGAGSLETVASEKLRSLVQFTADGEFRPLKSAPTLRRGWRALAQDSPALEGILNILYPGALADLYAIDAGTGSPTSYHEFTNRQTGMYRITQKLDDCQVVDVIEKCCIPALCLKRRLWSVDGRNTLAFQGNSLIPCLEPCAILLEQARKTARAVLDRSQ